MRSKKAISPLIATVLLIGFTIVLAALIFRWIGPLVTGPQKEITCNYLVTIVCANNVDLGIIDATVDADFNDTIILNAVNEYINKSEVK